MRRFNVGLLSLGALIGFAAPACAATQTDADRAARYAVELEKSPLDAKAPDQRQWLLLWVTETPDYNVTACDVLAEGQKPDAPYSAGTDLPLAPSASPCGIPIA